MRTVGAAISFFFRPLRRPFLALALLLPSGIRLPAQTYYDPPAGYYDTATGIGATLKARLHTIVSQTHHHLSYSEVWDALDYIDEDPANTANVILLYSGESRSKTLHDPGNDKSNWWNREHLWPLSLGPGGTGTHAGTDLHHLFAADKNVNAARGNLPFHTVTGGSTHPEAPECRYNGSWWEPRDADKGRIARSLFYMAVRYEPGDSGGNLELGENTGSSQMARLSTLLAWHRRFPVDGRERLRNHRIHAVSSVAATQRNRNPFVDNPYYADMVFTSATARGAWRNQKFTTAQLASPAISGDTADPDGDGLPNLLEYAFNLDPLSADPGAAPSVAAATLASGAPALALTYRRNRFASDLTFDIERSTDQLATWTSIVPEPVSTTRADALTDTVTVRVALAGSATFVRLRVTSP